MKTKMLFFAVFVVVVGIGSAIYLKRETIRPTMSAAVSSAVDTSYVAPPVVNEYKNSEFHFSLSMPDGFHAQEIPNENDEGKTVILQNDKGEGIQILITPATEDDRILTAEMVRAGIPDMKVSGEQPVEIGANHTGVAFLSNNDAFGGASREVWFYFHGNLYQISTYAHLDPLLQAMFATWKFF